MASLLDIGNSLPAARRALGMSQRALGEVMGASQQQVSRWERSGYASADLDRVATAAETLGLSFATSSTHTLPAAAETPATYGTAAPGPVADLGDVVRRIRESASELGARFSLTRVAVVGSFARGTQSPGSDVDLVVEMEQRTFDSWFGAITYLEQALGRRVDLGTPDSLHERIRDRVLSEAVEAWHA